MFKKNIRSTEIISHNINEIASMAEKQDANKQTSVDEDGLFESVSFIFHLSVNLFMMKSTFSRDYITHKFIILYSRSNMIMDFQPIPFKKIMD